MSLKDIEAAIPNLLPNELRELRDWLDHFCEDHLDLTEAAEESIRQAEQEIREGKYRVRQTP